MSLDKLLSNLTVEVDPFSLCTLASGWRLRLPGPPDVMVHFVFEGHGVLRGLYGEPHRLERFWMAIVPRGVQHALDTGFVLNERQIDAFPEQASVVSTVGGEGEQPALVAVSGKVRVSIGDAAGLFDHLREVLTVDLSDKPQARAAFEGILEEQRGGRPGVQAMASARMVQCLILVLRDVCMSGPQPWMCALDDPRLARAMDAILADPAASHSVSSLAHAARMSRSVFAERFAAVYGRPPMSLVKDIRMRRAATLLQHRASLSIDQVAGRVGFSSRSHFSRSFKRHFGVSPAAFRG